MKRFGKSLFCVLLLAAGVILTGCSGSSETETAPETETAAETTRAYLDPADRDTILRIHTDQPLDVIDNKLSNMNMWNYNMFWQNGYSEKYFENIYPFVEEMQFMTATGGESGRDLFLDPADRTVLDDYDFSPLVTACRNVVDQGLTPVVKIQAGRLPELLLLPHFQPIY